MPIILASRRQRLGELPFEVSPGKKSVRLHLNQYIKCGGTCLSSELSKKHKKDCIKARLYL
jgi:hypothetical protein